MVRNTIRLSIIITWTFLKKGVTQTYTFLFVISKESINPDRE